MDSAFPFGLPTNTTFYLVLYLVTFVVHQVFAQYVVAGTIFVSATLRRQGSNVDDSLVDIVRDWLPFALSAAITAGIAPLLFIQILYREEFYTANLLLWWRWMLVVPALIVGFYFLYVIKSQLMSKWSWLPRFALVSATSACFVFVGFCWMANHILATAGESTWVAVYETGRLPLTFPIIAARMGIWLGNSLFMFPALLAWQAIYSSQDLGARPQRQLLTMVVVGAVIMSLGAVATWLQLDIDERALLQKVVALPYVVIGTVAFLGGLLSWGCFAYRGYRSRLWLALISLSHLLVLTSAGVIREVLRLNKLELSSLFERHTAASEISGFGLFLLFAIINTLLMAFCIRLVVKNRSD